MWGLLIQILPSPIAAGNWQSEMASLFESYNGLPRRATSWSASQWFSKYYLKVGHHGSGWGIGVNAVDHWGLVIVLVLQPGWKTIVTGQRNLMPHLLMTWRMAPPATGTRLAMARIAANTRPVCVYSRSSDFACVSNRWKVRPFSEINVRKPALCSRRSTWGCWWGGSRWRRRSPRTSRPARWTSTWSASTVRGERLKRVSVKLEGKPWEAPVMFSMSSVNLLWPYTYITAISSRKAIRVRPVAPKLKIWKSRWAQLRQSWESKLGFFTMGANCPKTRQVFSDDVGHFVFGSCMDWTPTCRREWASIRQPQW